MSDLAERLCHPARDVTLEELASVWTEARVSAVIPGHADLANDVVLLRRIRGGIGRLLLQSASPEAIAGAPCPWEPPCALDVLFREQGRAGARGIPKPFVLSATRKGWDLVVTLTLFGFAVDWAPVAAHALTAVLTQGIDWRGQRPGLFLPPARVGRVATAGFDCIEPVPGRSQIAIEFVTPLMDETEDLVDRPTMILTRAAWRIAALAAWQGVRLIGDDGRLRAELDGVRCDASQLKQFTAARHSGRGQRGFNVPVLTGVLVINDPAPVVWVLLAIGQRTHVGKGAVEGFGRFVVV